MQAEIITIGDEILIGQIVDTNSVYLSKALNKIGISVYQITSIQDTKEHILEAFENANKRAQVVLVTGGLGPTKDDVTKHAICHYFEDILVQDKQVLNHIEELFKKYISTPISDMNRQQAMVPSKANVLKNTYGTAPGLWLEKNGTVFVSMPGVPFEMKGIMEEEVLPRLMRAFERPYIAHRTVNTYGLGESAIAERIAEWENKLPVDIKLAYLPSLGKVRLRLSSIGTDEAKLHANLQNQVEQLYSLIGDIIQGEEEEGVIEAKIGAQLKAKGFTLATAESFTGGRLAELITAIPGASNYFKGSVVSYATETKIKVLGVAAELIEKHSVVSEAVAIAMARQVKELIGTDFSIATTGNAGPSKGDSNEEVGTVFIAIGSPNGISAHKFNFGSPRERVVEKAVGKAFQLLQKEILNF
ncbi:competence/damage-inducible protein A [Croceivirga radicis]|uniref:CinA-like protein n=1 Tax=Croceivirga radicis TaxID=1929488 RepID=A0A1V6LNK3_9FLAO|nr:competence/damage-inducible protein A [Croceivirga radicis]OQD41781.1 competence/damage-inducible protein A [Croceivirga radicis]